LREVRFDPDCRDRVSSTILDLVMSRLCEARYTLGFSISPCLHVVVFKYAEILDIGLFAIAAQENSLRPIRKWHLDMGQQAKIACYWLRRVLRRFED
jgi:hypothetical protein